MRKELSSSMVELPQAKYQTWRIHGRGRKHHLQPGRTDNDIKNYWNTRLKKKLMAKQRKEQAACRASLLEQELKREGDSFLVNQALNQVPYWEGQQLAMPIMHLNHDAYLGNQDQFTRLLTKIGGQLHDDPQLISSGMDYQYSMQDHFYVDSPHALASSSASMNSTNTNSTEWPPTEYDVNGVSLNIHQRQANQANIPTELVQLDVYLSNLLSFEGTESYTGIDIGKSSTMSTSVGSTSWADMSSLVNTPESNFDICGTWCLNLRFIVILLICHDLSVARLFTGSFLLYSI